MIFGALPRTLSANMEKLFCILNAAEGQLDIHLCTEEHILVAQSWHAPTRGAEILTPALQNLFSIQKLSPEQITHFACVHGPGSFTGIRLILGTVAAIKRITGAQNASIDYMQALALTAQMALQEISTVQANTTFAMLTHARRNLVHAQFFTSSSDALPQAQGAAHLLSPAQALEHMHRLTAEGKFVYALGSALARNAESFRNSEYNICYLPTTHPSPRALHVLALKAHYHKEDLEPLYVRPCDAVENLDHIAQKQGMDSAKAHETLVTLLKKETRSDI